MNDFPDRLFERLAAFPKVSVGHFPTPLDHTQRLGSHLGLELYVKRDDCTGFGFGGNKVRQLAFYFGAALAEGADTILITGAVQSNYARTTAAMAGHFGMGCHLQLEERVADPSDLYRTSGNVLLDDLLGAVIHSYPEGEDEIGADRALRDLASTLGAEGKNPFVIPLGPDNPPVGALGYVVCAAELLGQMRNQDLTIDQIVVPSGSAFTHAGLLFGLRALGCSIPVIGMCVRRNADLQAGRVLTRAREIGRMLDLETEIHERDVDVFDHALAPGYGKLNPATKEAIRLAARTEGLFLDPVYTGKTMAGMIAAKEAGRLKGDRVVFLHTGGQPALFAYADQLTGK
ncbi:MAG: D-cysteine desulfhydrase family protein [Pseudomonadota bacterium]